MRIRCGCEGGGKGPLLQVEKSGTLATGNDQYLFAPHAIEILNDQGGNSMTVERAGISPTLRSQTHGNLPIVAAGLDLQQITSKTNRSALKSVQPTLCGSGRPHVAVGTLCMATAQANAEILKDSAPTLTCNHEQPVVASAGFRYKAAGTAGSVGYQEETAPTLVAGQPSGILKAFSIGAYCSKGTPSDSSAVVNAVDCRNLREIEETSGTLQAKTKSGGYSLNYQNPVRIGLNVRRLTPLEAERLMGFPDLWTQYGHDGREISDSKRYSMLGNSIAVPCVAYIMQGIQDVLLREEAQ